MKKFPSFCQTFINAFVEQGIIQLQFWDAMAYIQITHQPLPQQHRCALFVQFFTLTLVGEMLFFSAVVGRKCDLLVCFDVLGERRLDPATNIMSVCQVNPNAKYVVRSHHQD
jgi:hypothetical protein